MGLEKWQIRRLLDYGVTDSILCMVTEPHKMVGLERMSDYRGVGLEKFPLYLHLSTVLRFAYTQ